MRLTLRLTAALFAICAPGIATAAAAVPAPTARATPLGFGSLSGIEAMTSTVMQSGQSSFSGLGLRLNLRPPGTIEQFELLPYVEYWRNKATVAAFDIESVRRDATLGMDARYVWRMGGWSPYLGAGLGMHFLSTQVDAPNFGLTDARESAVKGALSGLGGVSFPLGGRVENFLELKYHHLSDASQLKLNWGLTWGMSGAR